MSEQETFVRVWRFVTILLSAVALSAGLAHLTELPGKLALDGKTYATLHRTVYLAFGLTAVWVETLALVGAVGLAWRLRDRGTAFRLTAAATACQFLAVLLFVAVVLPASRAMDGWSPDALPANWAAWRARWEYGHAVRAVLLLAGFAALVWSVVRETTPADMPAPTPVVAPPATPPPAALETPRAGTHVVVMCDTPSEGLRLVHVPDPRKAQSSGRFPAAGARPVQPPDGEAPPAPPP